MDILATCLWTFSFALAVEMPLVWGNETTKHEEEETCGKKAIRQKDNGKTRDRQKFRWQKSLDQVGHHRCRGRCGGIFRILFLQANQLEPFPYHGRGLG